MPIGPFDFEDYNKRMSTRPMVPVEEYLRMRFDGPDMEYLDGELVERHLGGKPHSAAQANLAGIFFELKKRTSVRVYVELHVRTAENRYRIADLAVFLEEPEEDMPSRPPLVTIEIVSPDDSLTEIRRKSKEYLEWGVKHVWLVDPVFRTFSVYDGNLRDVPRFELPEFSLQIAPEQVFG